jgi:hypothetical protein
MQNIIIIIITIIITMAVEVDLKAAQREITSAHDPALLTKYHATKTLQTATASKCALCQESEEKMCVPLHTSMSSTNKRTAHKEA